MSNQNWLVLASLLVVGLIIGGIFVYGTFPRIIELKPDKCAPVDCIPVPCTPIEVEKIVEVENNFAFRDSAVDELFKEDILEDLDLLECNGEEYDIDQVKITKVYDSFGVSIEDEDNYEVTAGVKLKYKQEDEKQCYNIVDFKVIWDEDEKDPEVEIL